MRDIALSADVSLATVSLVLNGRPGISTETRKRVMSAAGALGYQAPVRRTAGSLETIGLLIEHLPTAPDRDPFNRHILRAIESAARRAGYRVVVEFADTGDGPRIDHWSGGWASGLLVLGGGDLDPEWVATALEAGLPVVVADHFIPGIEVATVVFDNFAGAYEMTNYLRAAGHTRIGFLRGPSKYWTLEERRGGYLAAMHTPGTAFDLDLIPPRISHGDEKGYGETLALLDLPDPPTAIFAVSDQTAIGAYRAVASRGLTVGQDISIVGFDDIDAAGMLSPPLTTVRNSGALLGQIAFERLLGMIRGDRSTEDIATKWTVPTRIIERESVHRIS
ncbi:MAG: LacI family DNA-binding transcriptional regulator [Thermomicrobiales bacterium]